MESLGYVDIFATKGIEYLLVIAFLLSLPLFWRLLRGSMQPVVEAPAMAGDRGMRSGWFRLDEALFYHRGHSWTAPEAGAAVKIGIDDFAQKLLGRPTAVELPAIGGKVEQGDPALRFRFGPKTVDIVSPVSGEIVDVNREVLESPALVNEDPYGKGWLVRVKVPKLATNLRNLLTGRLAVAWTEETVHELREIAAGDLGTVMQDGGLPVEGIARALSPDQWDEVSKRFLLLGE